MCHSSPINIRRQQCRPYLFQQRQAKVMYERVSRFVNYYLLHFVNFQNEITRWAGERTQEFNRDRILSTKCNAKGRIRLFIAKVHAQSFDLSI